MSSPKDEDKKEVDLAKLRGKRPAALRRKKKKSKKLAWLLIDGSGNLIPVPLTTENEEAQVRETTQRSIVEKHTPHMPYFEGTWPSGIDMQQQVLEETTKRKAEAARAAGVRTSAQGASASREEVVPSAPQPQ